MRKYLRLARVSAWPAFSLTFVIPFAVGAYSGTSWPMALVGFAAMFLVGAFAFALNFYADRDTDRYHDGIQKDFDLRRQPLVTGEVTERQCRVFCVATFAASVILGFLVSSMFGLLVFSANMIGGVLYSHPRIRLKARPVGDIACISLLGVIAPTAGYLLGAEVLPSTLMMVFWFLATATGYVATVMSDYEFDVRAGLRTSAVFFGQKGLLRLMVVFCLSSLVVAVFIYLGDYPSGTRYFAAFAAAVLAWLTLSVWRSLRPPKVHVPVFSSRGRWIYVAPVIISLLFVSYAFVKIISPGLLPSDPFVNL